MDYDFEVTLENRAKNLFHQAFAKHLEGLGYGQTVLGGGGQEMLGFRRDDHLISFSVYSRGHGLHKVVVHSETVPLEDLMLASLQESAYMLLEPFCQSWTGHKDMSFKEAIAKNIRDLMRNIQ